MSRQIYVNLPVKDVERTRRFFSTLGFEFNPNFSDNKALCMIIGPDSYVMLLKDEFFKTFTTKSLTDANKSTEVLVCLSCSSRAECDDLAAKAVAAGGKITREAEEQGSMYSCAFEDPDGHIWELLYMEMDEQN